MADPAPSEQPQLPQHLRAIAVANRVRPLRAEVKRRVRGGLVDPFALVEGNVPEWEEVVGGMRVRQVIEAMPGIGPVTTDEILELAGIRPDGKTRFADVSYAGRKRIANLCRDALGVEEPPTIPGVTL